MMEDRQAESALDLARLKELALKATPGPWQASGVRFSGEALARERLLQVDAPPGGGVAFIIYSDRTPKDHVQSHADQHFIAAANPTAVLALLGEVERLTALAQALRCSEAALNSALKSEVFLRNVAYVERVEKAEKALADLIATDMNDSEWDCFANGEMGALTNYVRRSHDAIQRAKKGLALGPSGPAEVKAGSLSEGLGALRKILDDHGVHFTIDPECPSDPAAPASETERESG